MNSQNISYDHKYGLLYWDSEGDPTDTEVYSIIDMKTTNNTRWSTCGEVGIGELLWLFSDLEVHTKSIEQFLRNHKHISLLCTFDEISDMRENFPEYFI